MSYSFLEFSDYRIGIFVLHMYAVTAYDDPSPYVAANGNKMNSNANAGRQFVNLL